MSAFRLSWCGLALLTAMLGDQAPPCVDGRCAAAAAPVVEWRQRPDAPGDAYLFVNGVQVGGYHRERDEWREFNGRAWSAPRRLIERHEANEFRGVEEKTPAGPVRNFGLELGKMSTRDGCYSLCGRRVTSAEAMQALAGVEAFRDDSELLRVTVIGAPEQRQAVLDDFERHEALRAWKDRVVTSALGPDNPRVRDAGFKADGTPTIYVQTPDGAVLHRQDDYRGPELLAEALQSAERRRPDPHYDPSKDPDLNRRHADGSIHVKTWHLYLGAGVLLALLLRRKPS